AWEKAAVTGVIATADARKTETKQQRGAEHQKHDNRHNLDHREPKLNRSKVVDAEGIHVNHRHGKCCNPQNYGHVRKPVLTVNRRGYHFASHNDNQTEPIRIANRETRPRVQIHFCMHTESSGSRMRRRHLRQRPHHRQRNNRTNEKAQDDRRPRQLYGNRAAQKKSRSDRRTKSDHCNLPRTQLAMKSRLALDRDCCPLPPGRLDPYLFTQGRAAVVQIESPISTTLSNRVSDVSGGIIERGWSFSIAEKN